MVEQITNNMTYPTGRKLFVLGDSFAACRPGTESAPTWHRLTADLLSKHHGEPVHLINSALIGSGQDFCWGLLQEWFAHGAIGPDDYLIIALTHPSRYWFIERLPELTNVNIIDLDKHISKEEATAIELFIKHIQRPNLDTMLLVNRMAYLALMVDDFKLRRPLMLKCFDQGLGQSSEFEELNWSQGTLFEDIQRDEFFSDDREINDVFWRGLDGRFNHMCLSNHKILAEKIATALINDATLDITSGFVKKIIPQDWETNLEFQQTELDYEITLRNLDNRKDYKKSLLPWKNRRGIKINNK
jgi:hypothetical protein